MPVLTRFGLDAGTNSAAARRLLPPEGLIRRAVNLRLRRDNELEQRPGFTALATSQYESSSGTVIIHDLVSFQGRLFGFGKRGGSSFDVTDNVLSMFEFIGAGQGWRRLRKTLPIATDVRDIGSPAEVATGIRSATVAVASDLAVLAWDNVDQVNAYAQVFRPSDDARILYKDLTTNMLRPISLVTAAGLFIIIGCRADGTGLTRTSYAGGDDFTTVATGLVTVDTQIFAAAAVLGAPGGFVVVGTIDGGSGAFRDIIVRHYNDSFVQQMTVTVVTNVATSYLSIAANGPQNRITVLFGQFTSTVRAVTLNLTTGATVAGPTVVFTNVTSGLHSVRYPLSTAADFWVGVDVTSVTPRAMGFLESSDAHVGLNQTLTSSSVTNCFLSAQMTSDIADVNAVGDTAFDHAVFAFLSGETGQEVTALGDLFSGQAAFFKDFGTAGSSAIRLGSHVQDASTGKWYVITYAETNDAQFGVYVTEYRAGGIRRRQTAIAGGLLYVANGVPLVTDGLEFHDIGWGQAPEFLTITSSNAAGSVTASARYFVQCCAEYIDAQKNIHRGPPSTVQDITLGASDNTISGTINGLRSLRKIASDANSFRLVFFRTAALDDLSAGENLYRETAVSIPVSDPAGDLLAFTLTASDATLRAAGETIYTQSQTPYPNLAPPPGRYIWSLNNRIGIAGLPRGDQILESKLLFPNEGAAFTDIDLVQYQVRASENVFGIASLDGNRISFTRREIEMWTGDGPDHSGQGEFTYAACLSREGGLMDADAWRSLLETDEGVFFQRQFDQLCFLTKNGDVDRTIGDKIRDELVTYPVVVAACYLPRFHHAVFAIQNAAGDAGELLTYDLRKKAWFVDDVGVVDCVAEYQGRLVYCDRAGAVFQQNALPGTGAMPTQVLDTHDFDFGTGQSWGEIISVGAVGERQGDATLALSVTFDGGVSYAAVGSWAMTSANNYTAGATFSVSKSMPVRKCALFGLRWTISGSSGSAGLRLNEITLETETMPGLQRLGARDTQ